MHSYVWRELVRNPRRTLVAAAGVVLGVGLFSGVLFFIDGSGATMTARAVAPLALDMQRVLTSPLGSGLRLRERAATAGPIAAGDQVTITLRLSNGGTEPAHDVVVQEEPQPSLRYLRGTLTLNGARLADAGGASPLAQGVAGLGRNIGDLAPGATVTIAYRARAARPLRAGELRLRATVSSRESLVPTPANGPRRLTLEQVRTRIASIPGVASADGLAFVDLPAGSLRAGGLAVRSPLRVFAFDRRYRAHYPSIRIAAGGFRTAGAVLSAEAARALRVRPGGSVTLRLPAGRRLSLPVTGVADLSRARPLFASRRSRSLEAFLYVPHSIVVSPATFDRAIAPALRAERAALGAVVKSLPVEEVDVRVERRRLHASPAGALAQTRAVAGAIARIAPRQDYLIDNISNTLIVARADASAGKRMFLFLGLPAILLAGLLAAYAGGMLATAQRREHATLRLRGAGQGQLTRLLVYRTLAVAGAGSALGVAGGFLCAVAILGSATLLTAPDGDLALSALTASGAGLLATGLALFVPGRRALVREIAHERRELALPAPHAWWRFRLDLLLLSAAIAGELVFALTGALDGQRGSVFAGRSVALPSRLLVVPLLAWVGGVLVSARVLLALALRMPASAPDRHGALVRGLVLRSLRRRPWELTGGIVVLGLVLAFGTSLRAFAATYDAAKSADAGFVVGSDLRITPGGRPRSVAYASRLHVAGISGVTPVVSDLENSILIGAHQRATTDLTAIDAATFGRVARLSGSSFEGASASAALAALGAGRQTVLIDAGTAGDLSIEAGDRVRVVLALGTSRETTAELRVAGLFTRLAGFARTPDIVLGLATYAAATSSRRVDFFLARTSDHSDAGRMRAVAALRARGDPLGVETANGAFDTDQSSLTALNVRSLVDLGSLFTLLMGAAAIGIFTFGLTLQRRREFVSLRAHGMHAREVRSLVLADAALVATGGLVSGLLVGTCAGFLLVRVLRPLFIVSPGFSLPARALAGLALEVVIATLVATMIAMAALRRIRTTEILREP